jgi:hypothetical protein
VPGEKNRISSKFFYSLLRNDLAKTAHPKTPLFSHQTRMSALLIEGRILNIMKDMKQQNTVNLGNSYLSNQCESAQSVVKKRSIKMSKLCKTNPISKTPKMNLTLYFTITKN